ncbi:uncharacterized protein TNCT_730031 [Trichonephila clavata]|uniref:DNA helicase n=1 Tax=Trichonephila clavata TaxID=2740835 RepID=A0A8X6KAW6_TRICU|nr:uncharacterized protein TNCT_730031 [Trichonephila clavata]
MSNIETETGDESLPKFFEDVGELFDHHLRTPARNSTNNNSLPSTVERNRSPNNVRRNSSNNGRRSQSPNNVRRNSSNNGRRSQSPNNVRRNSSNDGRRSQSPNNVRRNSSNDGRRSQSPNNVRRNSSNNGRRSQSPNNTRRKVRKHRSRRSQSPNNTRRKIRKHRSRRRRRSQSSNVTNPLVRRVSPIRMVNRFRNPSPRVRNRNDNIFRSKDQIIHTFDGNSIVFKDYLNVPKNRKKRSVNYSTPNMDVKLLHDIALELSVDFGLDLSLDSIQHILKKRVPGLVFKATTDIPIKSVMIQAILKSQATTIINVSKMAAKGVSTVSSVFSLYGIVSMIFDIFDPFEYNRILDKATLDSINRQLDLKFYKTEFYKPIKVTPDFVWENMLLEEDQTESYTFMAERIKEYLNELHKKPPDKKIFKLKKELFNNETKMTGGPGSGKTYTVVETFKHLNIATIKMAPTARIACKIEGKTIHSTMRLDWREGSRLKQIERELQEENDIQICLEKSNELKNTMICNLKGNIIIVDEMSLIPFWLAHALIKFFFENNSPVLFIAMGDKRQLKPVMSQYNIFHVSFDQEFENYCIEFKESKRFIPEYLKVIEQLRELVDQLEENKLLEFISKEFPVVESIDTNILKNCKKALVYKNATADVYNSYYTSQFPGKAYRLYKIENGKVCKKSFVDLKPGCEVAVTENFATKRDLQNVVTNGTVLIFEKYIAKYDTCKCIDMNGLDVYIKRNEYSGMIPLVPNFARTIHKYQGETIDTDGIVFNFDGCTDLNLIYTALSRVCSMKQIIAVAL